MHSRAVSAGRAERRQRGGAASTLRFEVGYVTLSVIAFSCPSQPMASRKIPGVNSASEKSPAIVPRLDGYDFRGRKPHNPSFMPPVFGPSFIVTRCRGNIGANARQPPDPSCYRSA